jgi:hypothetical protein
MLFGLAVFFFFFGALPYWFKVGGNSQADYLGAFLSRLPSSYTSICMKFSDAGP